MSLLPAPSCLSPPPPDPPPPPIRPSLPPLSVANLYDAVVAQNLSAQATSLDTNNPVYVACLGQRKLGPRFSFMVGVRGPACYCLAPSATALDPGLASWWVCVGLPATACLLPQHPCASCWCLLLPCTLCGCLAPSLIRGGCGPACLPACLPPLCTLRSSHPCTRMHTIPSTPIPTLLFTLMPSPSQPQPSSSHVCPPPPSHTTAPLPTLNVPRPVPIVFPACLPLPCRWAARQ